MRSFHEFRRMCLWPIILFPVGYGHDVWYDRIVQARTLRKDAQAIIWMLSYLHIICIFRDLYIYIYVQCRQIRHRYLPGPFVDQDKEVVVDPCDAHP